MEEIIKQKNGQAGPDNQPYLRNRRIEICVSPAEYRKAEELASRAGYRNVAQFMREAALAGRVIASPHSRQEEKRKWLYEINRIGNNINQIARWLNEGNPTDSEILILLHQIQQEIVSLHLK
jgi:hypothetical protein